MLHELGSQRFILWAFQINICTFLITSDSTSLCHYSSIVKQKLSCVTILAAHDSHESTPCHPAPSCVCHVANVFLTDMERRVQLSQEYLQDCLPLVS